MKKNQIPEELFSIERLKQEDAPEITIPKMAIVGILNAIQQMAKSGKQNVIGSAASLQPIDLNQMSILFKAIEKYLNMLDCTLYAYQLAVEKTQNMNALNPLHSKQEENPDEKFCKEQNAQSEDQHDEAYEEEEYEDEDDQNFPFTSHLKKHSFN